jgi:hypothetical protein
VVAALVVRERLVDHKSGCRGWCAITRGGREPTPECQCVVARELKVLESNLDGRNRLDFGTVRSLGGPLPNFALAHTGAVDIK